MKNNYLNVFTKTFENILEANNVIHCSNDESFAFFVFHQFIKHPRQYIIVLDNLLSCQELYDKLSRLLNGKVFMYCVDEVTKFTSLATSPEMLSLRLYILNKLLEDEPMIVVTHTMAITRYVPSKEIFLSLSKVISLNDECELLPLIQHLIHIGYKNVLKVTQPFEYSYRGGVIDIFSINYDKPFRIEFFDKYVDSIRFFDVDTQRTLHVTNSVKIIPATEFLVNDVKSGVLKIK